MSTKLNRSHTVCGDTALILPCLGRTERDRQASGEQYVTVEDSMGMVHGSRGRLEPASPHLRSEVAIVAGLAAATLCERTDVDWAGFTADYGRLRDHIEAVVPGFDDFNARSEQRRDDVALQEVDDCHAVVGTNKNSLGHKSFSNVTPALACGASVARPRRGRSNLSF